MKKSRLLCLVLVFVMMLTLVGCNGNTSPEGDKAAKTGTTNKDGGKPKIAFYGYYVDPLLNWDPSLNVSNGVHILNNIYETLLQYNTVEDKFEYVLATDYEVSEDGLDWIFNLRKGVKFHDGTDFNADAVKFSIERTLEKGQGDSYMWREVKEINVLDDYKIEFKLNSPMPLDLIASSPKSAFIYSPTAIKENGDDWFTKGNEAGTGPYKLYSFNAGSDVVLEKFDEYWGGWKDNQFDKVVTQWVGESTVRRQMIEAGEADVVNQLPAEDIEALSNSKDVYIHVDETLKLMLACINTKKAPCDNVNVRKALAYAFPYKDAIEYALGGYAKQTYGCVPSSLWGSSKDIFQYNTDLDKAKELLQNAGYAEGKVKLLLTYSGTNESQRQIAEMFKSNLAEIGVELEIRGLNWDSQSSMAKSKNVDDQQHIFLQYSMANMATPYNFLQKLFRTEETVTYNLSYYSNPEYDALIKDGYLLSGTDRDKAEELSIKAQNIILEDCPAIFIADIYDVWLFNRTFKGFTPDPAYSMVLKFYEAYREE